MEELTQASWTTAGLLDLVPIHVARGELDEAAAILESERALADGDNIELVVMYSGTASELLRARGDLAGALAAAERGVAGREQFGLLAWPVKIALIGGIDAAVALGDAAKAEELLGIVTSAPPGLVSPLVRAHATRFAARLAAMRGDHDAVEPGFAAAEALFRSISTPFPLAVVQLEHAEWLVSQGRATEAEPLLEESVQAFRELRAQPWLDRASRVGAGSGRKELV
jgi:ATP/maltotriose-dependent transcriptional regulator MalT